MIRENEISISVIRDSLFFSSVNRARDPPCTTLNKELDFKYSRNTFYCVGKNKPIRLLISNFHVNRRLGANYHKQLSYSRSNKLISLRPPEQRIKAIILSVWCVVHLCRLIITEISIILGDFAFGKERKSFVQGNTAIVY